MAVSGLLSRPNTFLSEAMACISGGRRLEQQHQWAGAEAVLMYQANGTEQVNLGYGDYLVTAQVVSPLGVNFATYDPSYGFDCVNHL